MVVEKKDFEFLEHTADVMFRAYGYSLEKLFANAAKATFHAMYEGKVKERIVKEISVEGTDMENLLYNFLEELLFLFDTENFFLARAEINIEKSEDKYKLKAKVYGDDATHYKIALDVKAVTYHDMIVKETDDGWMCQVVLDV